MTTAEVALEEGSRRKEAAVAGAADNDEHQTPRRRVKSERVKSERVEGHETRPSSERDVAGSRSSREKGEKVPNKASTVDSEESSNKRSSIFGSIGYNSAHTREMKRAAKEAARKISGGAKVATFGTGKVARAAVFCCGRNLLSFRNFLIHGPFIGMAVAWVVGQSLQGECGSCICGRLGVTLFRKLISLSLFLSLSLHSVPSRPYQPVHALLGHSFLRSRFRREQHKRALLYNCKRSVCLCVVVLFLVLYFLFLSFHFISFRVSSFLTSHAILPHDLTVDAAFFNSLIAFIITLMVVWCCVLCECTLSRLLRLSCFLVLSSRAHPLLYLLTHSLAG